jgi:hypothetical protein
VPSMGWVWLRSPTLNDGLHKNNTLESQRPFILLQD